MSKSKKLHEHFWPNFKIEGAVVTMAFPVLRSEKKINFAVLFFLLL